MLHHLWLVECIFWEIIEQLYLHMTIWILLSKLKNFVTICYLIMYSSRNVLEKTHWYEHMWLSSSLGGNPYCNNIDSIVKSSVCRFNESSRFLPGNIDLLKHIRSLNLNKIYLCKLQLFQFFGGWILIMQRDWMKLLYCTSSNPKVMLTMLHLQKYFASQITTVVLHTPDLEPLTNFECSYNKKSKIEDCILNDRNRLPFGDGGIWASYQKIIQKELSLSWPWTRWALCFSLLLCLWCLYMLQDICNCKSFSH